ncbi:MAG: FtsH protease activity modulator HflK [Ottowia sp.]|nr:FtsH protease activity modulator HflK [Ottowia sp.]
MTDRLSPRGPIRRTPWPRLARAPWRAGRDSDNGDEQRPDEPSRPRPDRGGHQGPPDLDELWNDFNRKLGNLFGGGRGGRGYRRPGSGGPGGGGGHFRPSAKGAGIGAVLVILALLAVWLASGIFIVREGERAVVTTFGKFDGVRGPGLNWRMPYPIQRHETVRFSQIRSVDVGGDDIIKSTGLRESAMLTADENIVEIKFAVQYRLNDARDYLFESKSPDAAVVQVAKSAVREVVGKMSMDTALAEERDQIAPRVRTVMQDILDQYKVGIEVVAVNMQDGGVRPPEQVQDAFDDVLKAGQERERIKNEAQAYANDVVPRAVGTAARLTQQSEGYKARIVAQAEGDASRFEAVLDEYEKAPRVTRDRMYIDALEQVYAGASKVIIDSDSGNSLMYLPLDRLMEQSGQSASRKKSSETVDTESLPGAVPPASEIRTHVEDARSRADARSRSRDSSR